jgi:hypothetical protein
MEDAESGAVQAPLPHTADWIGVVGGLFPFLFSWRAAPGVPPDWVAVVGGVVALTAGAFTTALLRRTPPEQRTARIAMTSLLLAVGVVQLVVRGFGLN